jgi:hypothetical protein
MLRAIKRKKANWIEDILHRNCHLKHITQENIEVTERRGRRRKELLDDLMEMRECYNLKGKALDSTLYRTRFGRDYFVTFRKTFRKTLRSE